MYLLCTPWQRGSPGRPSDSACVSSPDCFHVTCACTPRARRWSQAAQTDRCHTVPRSPSSWTWTAPQKPRTSARRSRTICSDQSAAVHINQHITVTYTHLTALFPWIPRRAGTRKVQPIEFTQARDSEWHWRHTEIHNVLISTSASAWFPVSLLKHNCQIWLLPTCPICANLNLSFFKVFAAEFTDKQYVHYVRL